MSTHLFICLLFICLIVFILAPSKDTDVLLMIVRACSTQYIDSANNGANDTNTQILGGNEKHTSYTRQSYIDSSQRNIESPQSYINNLRRNINNKRSDTQSLNTLSFGAARMF